MIATVDKPIGKTAVIESKSFSVRVRQNNGETVFAARDILTACGIKHPDKWLSRKTGNGEAKMDGIEKLQFPIMTCSGQRYITMYFVGSEAAKKVVNATPCSPDTKKWLLKEVLTYQIEGEEEAERAIDPPEPAKMQAAAHYPEALSRRIDNILFELLEIKKFVMEGAGSNSF